MLQDLLKKYLADDAKVNQFMDEMKSGKIYLTKEENMDTRYPKLKSDYDALVTKNNETQALIDELKKNNGDNQGLQVKIKEYEGKIAELEKKNQDLAIDNQLKIALLGKGAKVNDIDYLMYRIKQSDDELKLDKDGNIKGLNNIIEDIAKTYNDNFEDKSKKKVEVKDLPNGAENKQTVTKEMFSKMGYRERNKLYQENKELYDSLTKEGE